MIYSSVVSTLATNKANKNKLFAVAKVRVKS